VFLTHTGPTIDFKSVPAQRRLTEALLFLDLNVSLALPDDRLCPPVPNRLNYVLWIQDIVKTFALADESVRGIDIGTGASVIYPLLVCRLEPTWSLVGTDIDKDSLVSARRNVEQNGLSDKIMIMDTSGGSTLQPLEESNLTFHFTMCNPPFYASMEEVAQSTEAKEYEPSAVCTGAQVEMVTPGGEASFVSGMFKESLRHGMRCRWYTSMLGKMTSLPSIVGLLREHQVDNYAITEFVQGQTRRWAIAWSFGTLRLPDSLARITNPALQSIMPSRTTLYQRVTQNTNLLSSDTLYRALTRVLEAVEGVVVDLNSERTDSGSKTGGVSSSILVTARENTWSRSARRKMMNATKSRMPDPPPTLLSVMRCRITCGDGPCPGSMGDKRVTTSGPHLAYLWVDGSDRGVFESFVSHVNRRLVGMVAPET